MPLPWCLLVEEIALEKLAGGFNPFEHFKIKNITVVELDRFPK